MEKSWFDFLWMPQKLDFSMENEVQLPSPSWRFSNNHPHIIQLRAGFFSSSDLAEHFVQTANRYGKKEKNLQKKNTPSKKKTFLKKNPACGGPTNTHNPACTTLVEWFADYGAHTRTVFIHASSLWEIFEMHSATFRSGPKIWGYIFVRIFAEIRRPPTWRARARTSSRTTTPLMECPT